MLFKNLSIGCRNRAVGKDWVGIDVIQPSWIQRYPSRFILMDAKKLSFPDNSFELVYASYVFEHFPRATRLDVLSEWWRVVKIGGLLYLKVPNVARYCNLYVDKKWSMERLEAMMFGMQTHAGEFHFCGYDLDFLEKICLKLPGAKIESRGYGHRGRFHIPDLEIRLKIKKVK